MSVMWLSTGRSTPMRHGALFPDWFEERPADGIMQPDDLAEIYWQLHQQPRTAWTFETDVRAFVEPW